MTHVPRPGNPPPLPRPARPAARARPGASCAPRPLDEAHARRPPGEVRATRPPGEARAGRGRHAAPPLAARALAPPATWGAGLLVALACAPLAACAPTPAALPPAPSTSFSHYQGGADAEPAAPRAPGDEYADRFAFREGAPPGAEPWPPGRGLREAAFNPHRRPERGAPPAPRRGPAAR